MKEKKSAGELEATIMQEVRRHPDWSHVMSVSVDPSYQQAPHPTWIAGFITDGARSAGAAIQFAQGLAEKYDLA
jgi:hypothetical protein